MVEADEEPVDDEAAVATDAEQDEAAADEAATQIQSAFRAKAAKAEVAEKKAEKAEEQREQAEAATAIQSAARMHIAQQEVKEQSGAATVIQSAARMHIAQQEVQDKREGVEQEEDEKPSEANDAAPAAAEEPVEDSVAGSDDGMCVFYERNECHVYHA